VADPGLFAQATGARRASQDLASRTLLGVPKDEPSWLPINCASCGQRWYGIDRAHCAACHRTFAATELFDRHRVEDKCANPVALGMVKHHKSGIWEPRVQVVRRHRAS
jgi:ribosomal protein L37E